MDDFHIIYDITHSFMDTLLVLFTLNNIKKGCIIHISELSFTNRNILEKMVKKYNKYICENEGIYNDDVLRCNLHDSSSLMKVDIIISSEKIDYHIYKNQLLLGTILGYPVVYDLNELRQYRKKYKVYTFIFYINHIPENIYNRNQDNHLFNYLVKEDENIEFITEKSNDLVNQMNNYLKRLFDNTYITLKIQIF